MELDYFEEVEKLVDKEIITISDSIALKVIGKDSIKDIINLLNILPELPNLESEFVGYSINGFLLTCIDRKENIRYVLIDNHWIEMINRRENLEYYSPIYLFTLFLELNLLGCYSLRT